MVTKRRTGSTAGRQKKHNKKKLESTAARKQINRKKNQSRYQDDSQMYVYFENISYVQYEIDDFVETRHGMYFVCIYLVA